MSTYLLFDIGATKMRLAISRNGDVYQRPIITDTPTDTSELIALFKQTSDQLLAGEKPNAVAGGLTRKRWIVAPAIRALFEGICPVYIENDTAIVGMGEATVGAGRGSEVVAYVTISTGVGGVRLVNGQIDHYGAVNGGFEPGHQIIDYHEPGKPFEDYVSGTAVKRATGRDPHTILEPEFWSELTKIVAVGVHNIIVHWSPDTVVVGGSMMKKVGIPIDLLRQELHSISTVFKKLPEIKVAELGDFGGLDGSLALIKSAGGLAEKF